VITNEAKVILDLCGGSGAWSKPYRDAGYDVRVITLPDFNVTDVDFEDDEVFCFNSQSESDHVHIHYGFYYRVIHGILAAPPCTEFSRAKTTAPRDFAKGMETIRACMEIIWHCQTYGKLKFWALENPDGLLYRFLGRPPFKFEQWQFGGAIEKPTCLWGMFNAPVPTVTVKPEIEKHVSYNIILFPFASSLFPQKFSNILTLSFRASP
jgi:hypothetical protein